MDDDDDVMIRNGSVSDVFGVSGFLVVSWIMIVIVFFVLAI